MTVPVATALTPGPTPEGLPEPDYDSPMVTLVITNPVFPRELKKQQQVTCPHCKNALAVNLPVPDKDGDQRPVFWLIGQPHPFVPEIVIRRMYVEEGIVVIFSMSDDRKTCLIDEIPLESVRLIEKGMTYDVFVEELLDADDPDGDPDPDPDPEPNGVQPTAAPVPNSVS